MLGRTLPEKIVVKDLILMVVDCDVLGVVVGRSEKPVPLIGSLKSIVEDDGRIGYVADLTVAVAIKLLRGVETQVVKVQRRLVEELDTNNDVLVLALRILLRDGPEYLECSLHSVASLPLRAVHSLSRVVVPILTPRCTVKVNYHPQIETPRPIDGCIDVDSRARDVWRAECIVRPVADRDSDDVESRLFDLVEVLPPHKRIPVVPQYTQSGVLPKLLTKCILVHNVISRSALVCSLEDRRCDPTIDFSSCGVVWIKSECTHGSKTSHPPMLTPLILSWPHLKLTLRASLCCISKLGSHGRCSRFSLHWPKWASRMHSSKQRDLRRSSKCTGAQRERSERSSNYHIEVLCGIEILL